MKQDFLQLPEQRVSYAVIRRPRVTRRIHLELDPEGGLLVVAPRRMSRRAVNRALQQRAVHVSRFLREARSRQRELPRYSYSSGEEHPFLGEKLLLMVERRPGNRGRVVENGGELLVQLQEPTPDKVKIMISRWYRQQAVRLFELKLAYYSGLASWTGGQSPPMRLRRMKKTWGSCSSRGVITFNPHLVKAPVECIDYVVAHEICHLREHNHGRAFYVLQEQLYPQWREARARLKAGSHVYLHS